MVRSRQREVDVDVTCLDEQGFGRGRFEDRPVALRNALPGERVHGRILRRRGGVWYGDAQQQDGGASERVIPPCPAFPRCGGCSLQHLDYGAQLALKQQRLLDALAEHSLVPERVRAPVSGPRFHYRFKARLGVRFVAGEPLVGFREAFSNRVARMSDCKTLALPLATLLPELQQTLAALSVPDRVPQVELAAGDRSQTLVLRHLDPLSASDLRRLEALSRATGVGVYLQSGGPETIAGLSRTSGAQYLNYVNADYGLSFDFLATDFTQVNPYVNRLLVRAAVLALAPVRGAAAIDLFCGIGNFSLALAASGASVLGVEAAPAAVVRARHNAARNGLSGALGFDVADLYAEQAVDLPEAQLLLLDPPRSGAGPNLMRWMATVRPERVAYVSCNPATFAADARILRDAGFALREVGIFDMFPHTAHVETLGLFVREG
ncbi:MAG: 23S rRNA (uracil(1939)-C(5))-methyltransferase RlmD [Pseudomonadales bacterium]